MPTTVQSHLAEPRGAAYLPRQPRSTPLYTLVHSHLETLLARERERSGDGPGLPAYVEKELRAYLDCGIPARGFLRLRCDGCKSEQLVPFSCKSRGLCPSCTTRRMHDTAARLVDGVLPDAPYRQWVLSVPRWLRMPLALDKELLAAVLDIFIRSVFAWQRRKARKEGVIDPQPAAVTFVQRFSSALQLNVHFHTLIPDGVFHRHAGAAEDAPLSFHRLAAPTDDEVEAINRRILRKVARLLERRSDNPPDPTEDQLAIVAFLKRALPPRQSSLALESRAPRPSRRCSLIEGFSLHADAHAAAGDRKGLERLCRYGLRAPLALERFEQVTDERVVYRMKRAAPNGSTHLVLDPVDFLRRLVSLIPPPRSHLTRYHGAFASHSRKRSMVVPPAPAATDTPNQAAAVTSPNQAPPASSNDRRAHWRLPWADLLRRVHAVEVFTCPACGSRRRVIAAILDRSVARQILDHLGLDATAPPRAPPDQLLPADAFDPCVDPIYPEA